MNHTQLKCFLIFITCCGIFPAKAEQKFFSSDELTVFVSGYLRGFYGKTQSFNSGFALKTQGSLKIKYNLTDKLTVGGYTSARWIKNTLFPEQNKAVFYENYLTLNHSTFGRIDVGQLKNVGYLMHTGPKDVGLLDADDSDLSFFYDDPSGFYAPCMTYLGTDSRDEKINYTSPALNGWTMGLTVVQSEDKKYDTIAPNVKIDHGKGVISNINYKRNFNLTSLSVSASGAWYHNDRYRYKNNKTVDAHHNEYSIGFQIAHQSLSVGVSGRILNFQDKTNIGTSYAWVAGIAYDPNPWGISINIFNSSSKFESENRFQNIILSSKYQVTKYLKTTVSIGRLSFRQNDTKHHFYGIGGIEARF